MAIWLLPVVALLCIAGAAVPGSDPTILLEGSLGAIAAAWAIIGGRNIVRGRVLAAALNARARDVAVGDVACRVVYGGGGRVFVLGALRPRIYIGDGVDFDPEELRAVLLHEDHHRRTLAPLRAAALEAWLSMFGRVHRVQSAIQARLADLESQADAHAIRRGASASALASALLKVDPLGAPGAASFATSSDRRLRHLLALADGKHRPSEAITWAAPYEWLPLAIGAAALIACHLAGAPFV